MGTWRQKLVTLTLPGSSSDTVVSFTRSITVEYRNGEKQFKTLIACRMVGLGNPRSQ